MLTVKRVVANAAIPGFFVCVALVVVGSGPALAATGSAPVSMAPVSMAPVTMAPVSMAALSTAPKAAPLPAGAATGYPFGYVRDEGAKTSLLPPNDKDVNQARVVSAPKVGPFTIDPNGSPTAWPDACKLTTLAQLKALEPSITGLRGNPVGTKAELLGTGRSAPHNTECQFNLKTTFQPQGYGSTGSYVLVQFEAINTGAPGLYREALAGQKSEAHKYPAQYADYPNLKNGPSASTTGPSFSASRATSTTGWAARK